MISRALVSAYNHSLYYRYSIHIFCVVSITQWSPLSLHCLSAPIALLLRSLCTVSTAVISKVIVSQVLTVIKSLTRIRTVSLVYVYFFSDMNRGIGKSYFGHTLIENRPGGINPTGSVYVGIVLFSRTVSSRVSSALVSLTSVFGMGTGGSSPL